MFILIDKGDYYLCDDENVIYLQPSFHENNDDDYWWANIPPFDYLPYYKDLCDYDIGTYDYIFNEQKLFRHVVYHQVCVVVPTENLIQNYKSFARDIKINNIF